MSFSSSFAGVRYGATLLAAVLVGFAAKGQDGMTVDQFVQMRTNLGEQMRQHLPSYDNYYPGYRQGAMEAWSGRRAEMKRRVLLPPLPPAFGDDLPYASYSGTSIFLATDLSREIFYGPYATLVARNDLSAQDADRVTAYRKARAQLIREIDAKFDQLRGTAPAVRRAALRELARKQDASLQGLVLEAESIREDLAGVDSVYTWFSLPAGERASYNPSADRSLELFKALYRYPGLSIEERELIPEIAYDTPIWSETASLASSEGHGTYLYFLPATACIRLPARMTPSLEAKIRAFAAEKQALRDELRRAVLREDLRFSMHRGARLASLAAKQAPRFETLENLAEEIRIELVKNRLLEEPESSGLPADLTDRVGEFLIRKARLEREVDGQLRQLTTEFPAAHFQVALQSDGLRIVPTGEDGMRAINLTGFNASVTSQYTTLARDCENLRREIERFRNDNPTRVSGDIDQVTTQLARAYATREQWKRYRDYFRAVLEPGLSPAQRRLLFQSATENLDQAGWLPRAE